MVMGKAKRERVLSENEAQAVAKNLRVSPRKLNLVAQMIRGKKVDVALADLEFSRKRIAQDVRKCVMSAVANAENNHDLDVNDLVVAEAYVGKNLVIRRFHAPPAAGAKRKDRGAGTPNPRKGERRGGGEKKRGGGMGQKINPGGPAGRNNRPRDPRVVPNPGGDGKAPAGDWGDPGAQKKAA